MCNEQARRCTRTPGTRLASFACMLYGVTPMPPAPDSRDWHATFRQWAKPPSETEDQKAANAATMIRDAISASTALKNRNIDVYVTGSYRNNTNARTESDVDVAVVLKNSFFYDLPNGLTSDMLQFGPAPTYSFDAFRDDVEAALRAKFGRGVNPGDKAFDVHETSYRLDADVSVFLPHRRYTGQRNGDGAWSYYEGVEMRPRGGVPARIINWHQQQYDQGVAKNEVTGRRFKRVTRILKRLRTEMTGSRAQGERDAASPITSFFIECLVYNAPNTLFNSATETYYEDAKKVVGWAWNQIDKGQHADMKEVSEMKWLFRSGQNWTSDQAKAFLVAAWNYVGFSNT